MDALDRKILNIMQKNSRITVKQIAEECFISSPSVSVRLQNLEGLGYIRTYQAILDHQKLGFLIKAYVNCAVPPRIKKIFTVTSKKSPMLWNATALPVTTQCY